MHIQHTQRHSYHPLVTQPDKRNYLSFSSFHRLPGLYPMLPIRCPCPPVQSTQSTISQLCRSPRMISLCRSIFQWVYRSRAAPAARRCAGPKLPALASWRDLQTHVARFLPSMSGLPNQYLYLRVNTGRHGTPTPLALPAQPAARHGHGHGHGHG